MISRSNMRRQLRASGGITNARQGYGLGSWVKEKFRKLVPNELADIAVKAAPFIAPFNPAIAGAMRGIGRFDQRGSISDALKQGVGTYAGGQAARYLGGADFQKGLGAPGNRFTSPLGTDTGFKLGTEGTGTNNFLSDGNDGAKKFAEDQGKGFMEKTTDKIFDKIPFGKKLNQTVKEKLLVGGTTTVAKYLYEEFIANYPEPEPGEDMAKYLEERRQRVGTQMRTYMDNYLAYDPQYSAMSDAEKDAFVERNNKNMGGLMRTGYANGSEDFQNYLKGRKKFESEMNLEQLYREYQEDKRRQKIKKQKTMAADGGLMRTGYAIGSPDKQLEAGAPPIMYSGNMDPNAQVGLPSVPGPMQMAEDGPEFDMRENGGFQPLGRQEGKDDVPAMLAKNEFVMTADAVRAAGGGSIQKGAQKMYDTMKKLESRVS